MTQGRRPKPTAAKQLAGNPGKRQLNSAEPKPERSSGRVPRGLGETAAGFYRRYGGVLAELGILTKADEPGFRLMAIHFEVAERAYQLLRETGSEMELTVEGRDGERKHPLLQVLRDNSQMVKAWATEFGMTPAARPKLRTDEGEQLSLADILFGQALVREQAVAVDPLVEFARDDD